MKIGMGEDIHRTDINRPLILGGVLIESSFGLKGHSDADVLTHAIIDALLGALGEGDIGEHFSDSDEKNKDRSSLEMLNEVMNIVKNKHYDIVNIDCVVIAEKPKLSSYKKAIAVSLSEVMGIESAKINVKAKTYEKLGFLGQSQAIEAKAIVLIKKENNE